MDNYLNGEITTLLLILFIDARYPLQISHQPSFAWKKMRTDNIYEEFFILIFMHYILKKPTVCNNPLCVAYFLLSTLLCNLIE